MGRLRKLIPRYSLRTLVVFMVLVTSGMALWLHWEPWYECFRKSGVSTWSFSPDGAAVVAASDMFGAEPLRLAPASDPYDIETRTVWTEYNAQTGSELRRWEKRGVFSVGVFVSQPEVEMSLKPVAHMFVGPPDLRPQVLSECIQAGRRIEMVWIDGGWKLVISHIHSGECLVVLEARSGHAAAFSPNGQRLAFLEGGDKLSVWQHRRPEWWWGVFYLPEFWLTVAFAGLFVWSVVRDRRALGERSQSQST